MSESKRMIMLRKNHSRELCKTTRVKGKNREAKETVGITPSFSLLAEARKHNLNISRICEQALQSILEYIPQESETESSKFLTFGSFQKEGSAGPSRFKSRFKFPMFSICKQLSHQ